jgi:galactan endo-beta-1,3-galactanase
MKKMKPFLLAIPLALLLVQCKKTIKEPTATTTGDPRTPIPEAFETVIDNTFTNYATFEQYWNYLYPWGSDHNGTARMYGSATDHNHIYLDASGVLTIKATRINWDEGNSSADPHLPIRYHSGAINAKFHVLVNDQFPNYEIRGEFQAPSVKGSWPAFWLTGVNSWPPESDILEFKGNSNNWQNTFRTSSDVSSIVTNVSSPGSWHQYRIWMQKSTATDVIIHYYIDGTWKGQHTANFVGKPMYIIINMQMEGSSGSPGPTADTYFRARNIYVGRTRAF